MATVRMLCKRCGPQEVDSVRIVVTTSPPGDVGNYHFRCPQCEKFRTVPASLRTMQRLACVGCDPILVP